MLIRRASATALLLLVVIAGFATIYTARALNHLMAERVGYAVVIVAIIVAAGASAYLLFLTGRRKDRARATRRENHPYEPWLWWREDWAAGLAYDEKTRSLDNDWLLANLAVAVCTILLLAVGPAWAEERNPGTRPAAAAFVLAVAGAAMAFTWRSAWRTMRSVRKGSSVCRFEKMPIQSGGVFRATIELPLDAPPADGIVVTLQCHQVFLQSVDSTEHIGSRRYARGSPGRPATRIRPALHVERFVIQSAVRTVTGIHIPVSLHIPSKVAVRAARYDPQSSLEWSLDVSASDVPSARFTLPVFPNDVTPV